MTANTVARTSECAPLPAWMATTAPQSVLPSGRTRRRSFVEKTVTSINAALRESVLADALATRDGFLQRFDPRVKLAALLAGVLALAFVHDLQLLIAAHLLVAAAVWTSRLGLVGFFARVWLGVGLFVAVSLVPQLFSPVREGTLVLTLGGGAEPWGITSEGLVTMATICLRAATSVAWVTALTLTTPWHSLLSALGSLGLPQLITLLITMTHRYLFVVLNTAADLFTARQSRTVLGFRGGQSRRVVGSAFGTLLSHSLQLSTEVHQAMVARGFNGTVRTLRRPRLAARDAAFLLLVATVAAALLMGENWL